MAKIDKFRAKITLKLAQIDALDDLLGLYLDGDFSAQGINMDALLEVQEQIGEIMEVINQRLGFTDGYKKGDTSKYLM